MGNGSGTVGMLSSDIYPLTSLPRRSLGEGG
jgi:hypothetical protein